MDFKKLNFRAIILVTIAGLVFIGTLIIRGDPHGVIPEQTPRVLPTMDNDRTVPAMGVDHNSHIGPPNNMRPMKELTEEDTQSMKEIKEQMDSDRLQQKKIKMLKLQLEQTNLQLEQVKARSEISKLEKENTNVVSDSNDQGQDKIPDVKVNYIGGTEESKTAILSINGNNYSVKEKNRPVKNMQVLSISDTAVTIHFDQPKDLQAIIEYKPE